MGKSTLVVLAVIVVVLLVAFVTIVKDREKDPAAEDVGEKTSDDDQKTPRGSGLPVSSFVSPGEEKPARPLGDSIDQLSQLDPYLDSLEQRVRDSRQVLPQDLEAGIAAIKNFREELGPAEVSKKTAEFQETMADLAGEFDGRANGIPANPAALIDKIGNAENDGERRDLVKQFLENDRSLRPEEQRAILERLDQAMAKDREKTPANP